MKNYTTLHHSATPQNTSDKAIAEWTFYNRVIKPDGTLIFKHDTLHYRGNDNYSFDVCLVGNFENTSPTQGSLITLKKVIKEKGYPVIGHREIEEYGFTVGTMKTLCPGKNLFKWLQDFRIGHKILVVGEENISSISEDVIKWYADRGEKIEFIELGDHWAKVNVSEATYASGGCKNAIPYQIHFVIGSTCCGRGKSLQDILIHEIMHCYFFDAGLGDIHDIKTKEYPRGLTGSWANEYNWTYFLSQTTMKDKMTKEEVNKLSLLTFRRPMDEGMEPYIGYSFDFIVDEFLKAKEYNVYTPLFLAGKKIEKEL